MNFENTVYEVEFRCYFNSIDEACEMVPFLHSGLQKYCTWKTAVHGLDLFRSGQLLRTAEIMRSKEPRYYIGWKGPDTGKFANIRPEIDEEITPPNASSRILMMLSGSPGICGLNDVIKELEHIGYPQFMSFEGTDFSGYYAPQNLHLKLMTCRHLKWPVIVEIEKTASSKIEAFSFEDDLYNLCYQLQLQKRLIREEPPTLLFNAMFNQSST
jgi:hypothetical protein